MIANTFAAQWQLEAGLSFSLGYYGTLGTAGQDHAIKGGLRIMFAALAIGSFLDAFADDLSDILSPDLLAGGAAIDAVVFAQSGATGAVADFFKEGLKDEPVAIARFVPKEGEEQPVVVIVRSDAIAAIEASEQRSGELEIMLARFIDEVIFITTGKGADDAIFSSKIRDLLISVLR